jgi:hypothetical protein
VLEDHAGHQEPGRPVLRGAVEHALLGFGVRQHLVGQEGEEFLQRLLVTRFASDGDVEATTRSCKSLARAAWWATIPARAVSVASCTAWRLVMVTLVILCCC